MDDLNLIQQTDDLINSYGTFLLNNELAILKKKNKNFNKICINGQLTNNKRKNSKVYY